MFIQNIFNHVVPVISPISSSSVYPRNLVIFSPPFLKQNKTKNTAKTQNQSLKTSKLK